MFFVSVKGLGSYKYGTKQASRCLVVAAAFVYTKIEGKGGNVPEVQDLIYTY